MTSVRPLYGCVLAPDAPPDFRLVSPLLEHLQALVGGYLESIPNALGVDLYANEEGRLLGLPLNPVASAIAGRAIVGTCVLLRHDAEGEVASLTQDDLRTLVPMLNGVFALAFGLCAGCMHAKHAAGACDACPCGHATGCDCAACASNRPF